MRRILRKIAANKLDELGDTSTLAEPGVVQARPGHCRSSRPPVLGWRPAAQ